MSPVRTAAIIGGGIIGLSVAWRLAQRGWRVCIFDQSDFGQEASWAGAGMLAPGGEIHQASVLGSLAVTSRGLYAQFVQELEHASGVAMDYQECGALDLAYSAAEWKTLEDRAAEQAQVGIPSRAVSLKQVKTFWPRLNTDNLTGALFYQDDAIVDPRSVVKALVKACRPLQVEMHAHCPVKNIRVSPAAVAVEAACQASSYRVAVLASGAWSGAIPVEGVPPVPASQPVKGHLIGYQQPQQTCGTIVRHGHFYLLQRASGLLIAGATVEHAGFNRAIDAEQAKWLSSQASFLFPHLEETSPTETWVGFRPASEQLQLGSWHATPLFLAYGHYRNGILLAPVTAAELADQIDAER